MDIEVAHNVAGRLRLRVSQLTANNDFAVEMQQTLSHIDRVTSVDIRPKSRSIVISYASGSEDGFVGQLKSQVTHIHGEPVVWKDGRCSVSGVASSSAAVSHILGSLEKANVRVARVTGGLDLKVLVPMALLAFATVVVLLRLISRKKLTAPTWHDLLWFAFNTFIVLNLPLVQEGKERPRQNG